MSPPLVNVDVTTPSVRWPGSVQGGKGVEVNVGMTVGVAVAVGKTKSKRGVKVISSGVGLSGTGVKVAESVNCGVEVAVVAAAVPLFANSTLAFVQLVNNIMPQTNRNNPRLCLLFKIEFIAHKADTYCGRVTMGLYTRPGIQVYVHANTHLRGNQC